MTEIPLLPSSSFPRDSPFTCYFKTTDLVRTHRRNLFFQQSSALQVSHWSGLGVFSCHYRWGSKKYIFPKKHIFQMPNFCELLTLHPKMKKATHHSSSTTRTSTKKVFLLTRFLNVSGKWQNFSYVGCKLKNQLSVARPASVQFPTASRNH